MLEKIINKISHFRILKKIGKVWLYIGHHGFFISSCPNLLIDKILDKEGGE